MAVEKYGVRIVLKRDWLYAKEIRAFRTVLNVYYTFRDYQASELNEWIKRNATRSKWWFELIERIENAHR